MLTVGVMITIQHDSPCKDKEANWLPAPAEGFFIVMHPAGARRPSYSPTIRRGGLRRISPSCRAKLTLK
jgi:hypothetical protein